jgi:hypothetical protein
MTSRLSSRPASFEISPRVTGCKYAIAVSEGLGPGELGHAIPCPIGMGDEDRRGEAGFGLQA